MRSPAPDGQPVLVVGYGNVLCGDDAVGPRVVEALPEPGVGDRVHAAAVHQLTVDLVEPLRHAQVVIFVDASRELRPGEVTCRAIARSARQAELGHRLTPASLVAMTESLYGVRLEAYEVLVGGESFDFGEHLSPAVEAAIPTALKLVAGLSVQPQHALA